MPSVQGYRLDCSTFYDTGRAVISRESPDYVFSLLDLREYGAVTPRPFPRAITPHGYRVTLLHLKLAVCDTIDPKSWYLSTQHSFEPWITGPERVPRSMVFFLQQETMPGGTYPCSWPSRKFPSCLDFRSTLGFLGGLLTNPEGQKT